jgi:nuclear transport factor 2 (NTF2) superfamily protein
LSEIINGEILDCGCERSIAIAALSYCQDASKEVRMSIKTALKVPVETPAMGLEEARRLVKRVESLFAQADIEGIMAGYTDDVVVRFADFPEIKGKPAVKEFLSARFARQKNYRLRKDLRTLMDDIIGNYWEGEWEDARTGKKMKGRGTEFWTMRDGKVALWEATFNVWEAGGTPVSPIV